MEHQSIIDLCRQLRQNSTPEESALWQALRNRKFSGFKFKRQYPFIYESINGRQHFFIADFYCPAAKLIIELDGRIHDFQQDYDLNRDTILAGLGLTTLRIKNEELEKSSEEVAGKILWRLVAKVKAM